MEEGCEVDERECFRCVIFLLPLPAPTPSTLWKSEWDRSRHPFQVVQTKKKHGSFLWILLALYYHVWDMFFRLFRHKPQQLIVEYYMYTYIRLPLLRYVFQVVQTQTTAAFYRILSTLDYHFEISFPYQGRILARCSSPTHNSLGC